MKLYIKSTDNYYYKEAYEGDSGIDLFFPESVVLAPKSVMLVDLKINCEMKDDNEKNTSYYLYPRSSIYKTPLRMANSVGIIDAGYRDSLKVAIDNTSDDFYIINQGVKLFQICAPNLEPIKVIITDILSSSNRGPGFGSSGV